MAGFKNKNPFVLPERLNPTNLEDEYDHSRFKQWVSDLPVGNVSKVARALHHELDRQNHLEMSPIERFEALKLMGPSLGFVLEKLRIYFSTKPIPLSKANRLVARLHLELLVSIILGYKTVLAQFHDDSFTGYLLHRGVRSESSHHMLYFLGEVLLHEYSIYRTSPRFVWKEIHGAYFYAVQNDLLHKSGEESDDGLAGGQSSEDVYKRILLLAVTDPNGMLRGEVKKVNDALLRWLPETSLVPINEETPSKSDFYIDAKQDAPPCSADICNKNEMKVGWTLITDNLDAALLKEIDVIKGDSVTPLRPLDAVSVALLQKLRVSWCHPVTSRDHRNKKSGIIEVTCGLESLHQLFGGWRLQKYTDKNSDSAFSALNSDDPEFTAPTIGHDEFIIDAGSDLSIKPSPDSDQVQEQEIELDIVDVSSDGEIESSECISVNESEKGYYLTWPGEGEYKAHVGELIGVNSRENLDLGGAWSLGIIRWAQIQNHGLMGFGVELLDGDVEPIRLDRWYDDASKSDVMLGFQQKVDGEIASIITTPFYSGDKDSFLLSDNKSQIPVIPGQILECTDAVMRLEVSIDNDIVDEDEPNSKRYSVSDDPFNSLWDDLEL